MKSVKRPERGLLLQRKDPVVYYWEKARAQHERFDHDLLNITEAISSSNLQNAAFQRPVEAVEVTAVQRGAERWKLLSVIAQVKVHLCR
jgi:precorrin-6B methylase 1